MCVSSPAFLHFVPVPIHIQWWCKLMVDGEGGLLLFSKGPLGIAASNEDVRDIVHITIWSLIKNVHNTRIVTKPNNNDNDEE